MQHVSRHVKVSDDIENVHNVLNFKSVTKRLLLVSMENVNAKLALLEMDFNAEKILTLMTYQMKHLIVMTVHAMQIIVLLHLTLSKMILMEMGKETNVILIQIMMVLS